MFDMFFAQDDGAPYGLATGTLLSGVALLAFLGMGRLAYADTSITAAPAAEDFFALGTAVTHDAGKPPAVCFAPGTSQDYVNQVTQLSSSLESSLQIDPTAEKFRVGSRWSTTATDGGGLNQGDPTTLTWSYVPDGTTFGRTCGVPGELGAGDTSNFQATFNAAFANSATWHALFVAVFARWSELSGINFVHEPTDDGAPFAGFPHNPGVLGARGDIRIGGHMIDGNSNVLACNFFPHNGDMIIDTADNFFVPGLNNSLGVRNVIAHEIGHGLAFDHVCPVNQTKLMEPFVTTAFDGPQFDDTLAVQRLYGDHNELNDISAMATNHGILALNTPATELNVSVDNNIDVNFYQFTAPANAMATVVVNPTTQVPYLEGPQNFGGSCSVGTLFDPGSIHNLGLELLGPDGTSVIGTANANPAGQSETLTDILLPNGAGPYFVRVFGDTTDNIQAYTATTTLTSLTPCLAPTDLDLTDQTITTTEIFEACNSISAGPNFTILSPGNVTLRADEVILRGGFSVGMGARLTVQGGDEDAVVSN
jgi:hypothetical protein